MRVEETCLLQWGWDGGSNSWGSTQGFWDSTASKTSGNVYRYEAKPPMLHHPTAIGRASHWTYLIQTDRLKCLYVRFHCSRAGLYEGLGRELWIRFVASGHTLIAGPALEDLQQSPHQTHSPRTLCTIIMDLPWSPKWHRTTASISGPWSSSSWWLTSRVRPD